MSRRRAQRHLSKPPSDESGSAVAEFALVAMVLVPLFFAILQLAFVWHVKTTITAAASQGARYAAAYDRGLADGERRTADVINAALGDAVVDQEEAHEVAVDGQLVVELTVHAKVPTLVLWGPTIRVEAIGHAIEETLP